MSEIAESDERSGRSERKLWGLDSWEPRLRVVVALGLWSLSGGVMACLFWSLAGTEIVARTLAVVWAVLLTGAQILLWRLGGWRRWVTLGIEVLLLVSAMSMAWSRLQETHVRTAADAVANVRTSASYANTSRQLTEALAMQSALRERIAVIPSDFTTAAKKALEEWKGVQERVKKLSSSLDEMEVAAQSGNGGPTETGDVLGPFRTSFEFAVTFLLAGLTEISALALIGSTLPPRSRPTVARIQATPKDEVSADDYLTVSKRLGQNGKLAGYRIVSSHLGIGERRARELLRELVRSGKIRPSRTVAKGPEPA